MVPMSRNIDWEGISRDLDANGNATIEKLLSPAQCEALAALYPLGTDERRWVEGVMARKKGLGL